MKGQSVTLTFKHLRLFGFRLEVTVLGGLLDLDGRLDGLELLQMNLVLLLLPLGREQLACLGLGSVHLQSISSFD